LLENDIDKVLKTITTLNPKISGLFAFVLLLGLVYNSYYNAYSSLFFLIGIIVTLPVILKTWRIIENNWKGVFKKFYSSGFFERKTKVVYKSWKLTWWLVPYCLFVYLAIEFLILFYFSDEYLMQSFVFGSIFIVFLVTCFKSKKYYKQIR